MSLTRTSRGDVFKNLRFPAVGLLEPAGQRSPTAVFCDPDGEVLVEKSNLLEALSQGEKKALYILNVIFELEARRTAREETLVIVDDIADSFDYKNKYAIVQYFKDIYEVPFFKMILLTHNFDFFRTVQSRFVPYRNCLMVVKNAAEIKLEGAVGIKNIFAKGWKGGSFKEPRKRVALDSIHSQHHRVHERRGRSRLPRSCMSQF
jgi:hypothetical protein